MTTDLEQYAKETVAIPVDRYLSLLKSEAKLEALEMYGVDNWIGYGDALSSLEETEYNG